MIDGDVMVLIIIIIIIPMKVVTLFRCFFDGARLFCRRNPRPLPRQTRPVSDQPCRSNVQHSGRFLGWKVRHPKTDMLGHLGKIPRNIHHQFRFTQIHILSLWKIWKSVGKDYPIYYGTLKKVPNHQPVFNKSKILCLNHLEAIVSHETKRMHFPWRILTSAIWCRNSLALMGPCGFPEGTGSQFPSVTQVA